MAGLSAEWMGLLAKRETFLRTDIPHVPILVEDIPRYVSLADYEESCIKTIQTIGEIVPKSGREATILTITPENYATFPISLTNLPVDEVYVRNKDDTYSAIWVRARVSDHEIKFNPLHSETFRASSANRPLKGRKPVEMSKFFEIN